MVASYFLFCFNHDYINLLCTAGMFNKYTGFLSVVLVLDVNYLLAICKLWELLFYNQSFYEMHKFKNLNIGFGVWLVLKLIWQVWIINKL